MKVVMKMNSLGRAINDLLENEKSEDVHFVSRLLSSATWHANDLFNLLDGVEIRKYRFGKPV